MGGDPAGRSKKGWERLEAEIGRQHGLRQPEKRHRLGYLCRVAAAVILCFGIGGLLWLQSVRKPQTELLADWDKQPRLILENGEQILLGGEQEVKPEEENRNFVIDRRKKNIVYTNRQGGEQKKWQYNTLEVPRGAEYELILADGTYVWLNADTRLRYPTCFNTDERRVYLEGEAYFQVTKDTAHPFRVESEAQVVEVLGTQFNVYAYGHEERTYTTLVEGKVAVTASASGQHVQLMPGQQASLGRQGGEIVVGEVNIQQVVDWKNGMFVFDDLSLEAILRKVARWYDVEVFYRNQQAKAIVFKGNLPRYGELPELLKVLENSSEVHFSLKGNTLIVE